MLRVGIVGAGFMGQMHANVYSYLPGVKLVGVADILQEKAEKIANEKGAVAYSSFEEMLAGEELDLVDICLPTYLHCEYTVKAALAGKHVFCEKPMAMSLAEADKMIETTEKAGVKFMIGQCVRFWPEYAKLKELISNGELGRITSASFWRLSATPTWAWENWLMDPKKSGGALLDLHIHDVDFISYVFGEPRGVHSIGSCDQRGWNHVFTHYDYEDFACVSEGAWDMPKGFPFAAAFRVVGEQATAELRPGEGGGLFLYSQTGNACSVDVPKPSLETGESQGNISDLGGYFNELQYFVNCIELDKYPSVVTPQDARNSVKMVLAERKSLETRQAVLISKI
jgi:predicted dehydrogenase